MNTQTTKLEAFIDQIGLKHFKGHELSYYWDAVRGGVKNHIPDEKLWSNIVKTLIVADRLREITGSPLRITSSYRSPEYNAQIAGAASGSWHMKFNALDLIPAQCSPDELWHAAVKLRDSKIAIPHTDESFIWSGGIGRYPKFVHIDTRGYDANW